MTEPPRRRWGLLAVVAAALVAALLVALFGFGILVLPSNHPSVTVTEAQWKVLQGTTSSGVGWFGPSEFNYTGPQGFPLSVAAGGTISLMWTFNNLDSSSHNITAVTAGAPFTTASTHPALPAEVPAEYDGASLEVTVQAPAQGGGSYVLSLTVVVH